MIKNNKGFTLIEIIISIAVLSIISAIFLELFIKSDSIQKQGKVIDDQTFLISNALEQVLSYDRIEDFIKESAPSFEKRDSGMIQLDYFYNDSLFPVKASEGNYYLKLTISEDKVYNKGILYLIDATVVYQSDDKPLQMSTYYYQKKGE